MFKLYVFKCREEGEVLFKGFLLLVKEKEHIESKIARTCGKYLLHVKNGNNYLEH